MQDDDPVTAPEGEAAQPTFDRRRGPRRGSTGEIDPPFERRGPDRRRKKPGLAALFGALLTDDDEDDENGEGEEEPAASASAEPAKKTAES